MKIATICGDFLIDDLDNLFLLSSQSQDNAFDRKNLNESIEFLFPWGTFYLLTITSEILSVLIQSENLEKDPFGLRPKNGEDKNIQKVF